MNYLTNGKLHVDERLIWDRTRWNEFLADEREGICPVIYNVVLAGVAGIFGDYHGLIAAFRYDSEPLHPNRVWGIIPRSGEVLVYNPPSKELPSYTSYLHYAGNIYIEGKEV